MLAREGGRLAGIRVRKTAAFRSLGEALVAEFPDGLPPDVKRAFIGVAAAPKEGAAHLTNADFSIDCAALSVIFPGVAFQLLNDVEALAHLLTDPAPKARALRAGIAEAGGAQIVIAPGTGLGVALHVPRKHDPFIQATEAGHMTAACPQTEFLPLFETLMRRKGRLAAENLLSGPGLVTIRAALAHLAGDKRAFEQAMTTRQIIDAARADPRGLDARAAFAFATLLGSFCGDCALSFYARGGVFLAGSLMNAMSDFIATPAFVTAFEEKGLMSDFVAPIPVALLTSEEPVLAGLLAYASRPSR